jgi:antitoxin component YwqK of YwqJK toxin-antitoxin module
MMNSAFRLCLLIGFGLLSFSCHRSPVEAAYQDLEWKDDLYLLAGQPFTGLARDIHKNGKPKGEYPFQEGRLHGVIREWWDNGQLSTETHFDRGQRHGLNRYWTRKGNLMKEQVYDHDHSMSEKHYPVE